MNARVVSWRIALCIVFTVAILLWLLARFYIESEFPITDAMKPEDVASAWAARGQFGDMFGAFTFALSAITIVIAIYSTYQGAQELDRQNENAKWAANYNYLLDAKKMIAEDETLLELHGLQAGICKTLNVTSRQVAYVIIDLKAADLYYRMAKDQKIEATAYRDHLLNQPLYAKIVREIVLPGKFLGDSKFSKFIEEKTKGTSGA